MRVLPILFALVSLPALAAGLNDTGVTTCFDGANMVACTAANAGNAALYPSQDARYGRDAARVAGLLPAKIGGGAAGFDFTPLDASGNVIALTGTPPVPAATPACTRDNVTGLIWEVKTTANMNDTFTWANAAHYASSTNSAGLCGAHSGWRVPTLSELLSIVHYGTVLPAIDTNYFPNTPYSAYAYFWSSDISAPYPAGAWYVNFYNGNSGAGLQSGSYHVLFCPSLRSFPPSLAYRAGAARCLPTQAAFIDHGDGTLTDTLSGLMWDKCSWGQSGSTCATGIASTHTWAAAQSRAALANSATYQGYNDWRLPNIAELQSLVKIDANHPAIDSSAFPNTQFVHYWSSTLYIFSTPDQASAWAVDFNVGYTGKLSQSSNVHVRLVRSGQSFDSFDPLTTPSTYALTATSSPVAGGSASCTPNPVNSGSSSTCTATPSVGYTFSAWSRDCTGATCVLSNVTAAKAVTATFTQNSYPITASTSPVAGGTATCTPNPVKHGGTGICTAVPTTGYNFIGWSGDCAGSGIGSCSLPNVTAAKSVTASFALKTYSVTATASPVAGGTVVCTPSTVNHGASSRCTATPSIGYAFTAWGGACSGVGSCSLSNVTSAKTVTAGFTPTYTVTATASPAVGGTVVCTPSTVKSGANSVCTATPKTGYSFTAWSGDCIGATCSLSNVTTAKTVTAGFTLKTYTVTATASPTTGGTVVCTPGTVNHGASSVCMATPKTGYSFTAWSGACIGATCSLNNITSAKTVTASFR